MVWGGNLAFLDMKAIFGFLINLRKFDEHSLNVYLSVIQQGLYCVGNFQILFAVFCKTIERQDERPCQVES